MTAFAARELRAVHPWRLVRSAPATATYLLVLTATTIWLTTSTKREANQLLFEVSTNLHQLARVPFRTLLGSAFWLGGWGQLVVWAALFVAVVMPVERRLGWRRTVSAFAAGHLGASLLVAAGLWVALRIDVIDRNVTRAHDVGASYGFLAVAALATYLFPQRLRVPYAVALGALLVTFAAVDHSFTDFGHLIAASIGFACYPLVRPSASGRTPSRPA